MERAFYRAPLEQLKKHFETNQRSVLDDFCRVVSLTSMNMEYEKVAFSLNSEHHPFTLTKNIIENTIELYDRLKQLSFIQDGQSDPAKWKSNNLEEKHEELWQEIWSRHNPDEFQSFVQLKKMRLEINHLVPLIRNKKCVDFGCGNGSFSFAMLELGATAVTGIDFGEKSLQYARNVAKERGAEEVTLFKKAQVMDSGLPSGEYEFAVSNGVLHHLREEKIQDALEDIHRVLKPGGWFWYYIDGKDAISMDLWDTSVELLKDIDVLYIENVLKLMNISRNKMVHLMDGLTATYLHSTWSQVEEQLESIGFNNFRKLDGGTPTDLDQSLIEKDPYGKEKFGEGDIRILAQKIQS